MSDPSRTNLPLVLVIWLAGLCAAAQFGKIAVLYDDLGLLYPGSGIGLMVSVVGLVGLVFGATAGLFVERLGYRRVLVGALALGAVLSAIQSTLPAYPLMMLTRVIEGFSHLAVVVAGPVLIARVSAPRHYGMVMSLWSSFFGVSFALTAWGGSLLVAAYGAASLFIIHSVLMALLAAVLAVMVPRRSEPPDTTPISLAMLARQHAEIYASPRVAAPALGFVFYTAMYVALLTLLPAEFDDARRIVLATSMPLVSIVVSLTLGVWLLNHVKAVRLVQWGFVVAGMSAMAMWLTWQMPGMALVFALVLAGAMGLLQGASFATIPQLNSSQRDRAYAAGAIAQLGNLGTTSGTPVLAALAALFGITGVLIFVLPLSICGICVTAWLARRRARLG